MKEKFKRHQLTISQVVRGYLIAAGARHLSDRTLADYNNTFRKFIEFSGELPFVTLDHHNVEEFLESREGLTNKTLLNYHTGLSALWTWAVREGLAASNVVHDVTPPKPEKREIVGFTEAEFRALMVAINRTVMYKRRGKRESDRARQTADRDRAILLMLLDTGLRASELCTLKLSQVDTRNQRVQVLGKGALERSVPFSPRTGQALWRYLAIRPNAIPPDPVFVTYQGRPMDRGRLRHLLKTIGDRAGVGDCHPHRFRHTFAIQYLRNGGDPYTLQKLLGHSTLDMVRNYLSIAQVDLDKAHRRASPVDNWTL